MDACEALVVGGGPAGSSCAWALRRAGVDVVVLDRASFPRDKVCAGWVTPQVIRSLELDTADYARGRTFQPITAFRTGLIGDAASIDTQYDAPVSYGIRRCEFDHYLLARSGARLTTPAPLTSMRRDGREWIVNDTIRTPLVVGAGGHFCPVAKQLNPDPPKASLVVAQEVEFPVDEADAASYAIARERPELYFSRDLQGYGWCFRKGRHMNIGFGRLDKRSLPKGTAEFVEFLARERRVPANATYKWHGHAYLLASAAGRRVVDDGVLLVGDSAGLAYPQSGEGIRPAVESGLMAAETIVATRGAYDRERLSPHANRLAERFGAGSAPAMLSGLVPDAFARALSPLVMAWPWFVRRFLIDKWFLHRQQGALEAVGSRR
jgi:geranylgeranyl reductase family protein